MSNEKTVVEDIERGADLSQQGDPNNQPRELQESEVVDAAAATWYGNGWAVDEGSNWRWYCGAGDHGKPQCSQARYLRVPKNCLIGYSRLVNCATGMPNWEISVRC